MRGIILPITHRYVGSAPVNRADPSGLEWYNPLTWFEGLGEVCGSAFGGMKNFDKSLAGQEQKWGRMAKGQFDDSDFGAKRYGYDQNATGAVTGLATAGAIVDASAGSFVSPSPSASMGPSRCPPNVVRYGAHVQGPLPASVANTFRGGSYSRVTLGADTTLYRTYGGTSGQLGSYWSRTAPQGPLQGRMDLALPPGNTAQNVVRITVPKGTEIYEGAAAPSFGQPGGGNQVFIPRVNPSWVKP